MLDALAKAAPSSNKILGITFTKSVHDFEFYQFDFVLQSFGLFKRNSVLPYPGSYSEQPNKIIECFNVLSAIQHEESEKERKKQELQNKRKK